MGFLLVYRAVLGALILNIRKRIVIKVNDVAGLN